MYTFQVVVDIIRDLEQSCYWWSLMVRPLIVLHPTFKLTVIIRTGTDVNDKIVIGMILIKVTSHILNGVAIGLLEKTRGGESHGDYPVSDVGEVEFHAIIGRLFLGASHDLTHEGLHKSII